MIGLVEERLDNRYYRPVFNEASLFLRQAHVNSDECASRAVSFSEEARHAHFLPNDRCQQHAVFLYSL